MELLKVDSINEAIEKLNNEFSKSNNKIDRETISIHNSYGRIIAKDIVANKNIPPFNRSTVDGYACIAENTSGASETVPSFLEIVGESKMGEECNVEIKDGECVYVPTGGMLPKNATCMVMVEHTENITDKKIAIYEASPEGKSVVKEADDIKKGDTVYFAGHKISYADMGVLASIGQYEIDVYKNWNISIISTGDELIDENSNDNNKFKIHDVNTLLLEGLCKKYNFNIVGKYLLKDDAVKLKKVVENAKNNSDVIVISGGSSKGKKDVSATVISETCSSKVLTHGIAIKPGKPTITAYDANSNTFVFGLPGHPVAASTLFELLVTRIYKQLTKQNITNIDDNHIISGILSSNLPASPGRQTIQLVTVDDDHYVNPIFARSGIILNLKKATGYIIIEKDKEGLNKGDTVTVYYK